MEKSKISTSDTSEVDQNYSSIDAFMFNDTINYSPSYPQSLVFSDH